MTWTNYEMKKYNTLKVFNTLRSHGPLSRREIEKKSGLSWGTVSNVCNELLQREIIVAQKSITHAGRPPEKMIINPLKNLLLGIDVNSIGLNFNVISLAGNTLHTKFVPIENNEKDVLLQSLKAHTRTIVDSFPAILSINLSMQGKIKKNQGISIRTNFFKNWSNVNLVEFFTNEFHLPTYLYHDPVCLLAYHQKTDDRLKKYDNGISIRIDNGIGMAQFSSGDIYETARETACEIGHTIAIPGGRTCACGKDGCLEAYASLRGMNERYTESDPKTYPDFISALHNKDPFAQIIYEDATRSLGMALSNLYSLFDPSFILIDGYAISLLPTLFDDIKTQTEYFFKNKCNLIKAVYKKEAPAIGAAYLTIDKIIEGILFA